jgi:hypothetical protein
MKTTVEIADALLIAAKKRAAENRTTFRAVLERALRRELARTHGQSGASGARRKRRIHWITAPGGLPPGLEVDDRAQLHDGLRRDG